MSSNSSPFALCMVMMVTGFIGTIFTFDPGRTIGVVVSSSSFLITAVKGIPAFARASSNRFICFDERTITATSVKSRSSLSCANEILSSRFLSAFSNAFLRSFDLRRMVEAMYLASSRSSQRPWIRTVLSNFCIPFDRSSSFPKRALPLRWTRSEEEGEEVLLTLEASLAAAAGLTSNDLEACDEKDVLYR